jgi:MFS family permease
MGYIAILIITIFSSFIVVRIGGLALQLTGIEPDVARFQALSAFSGTGFTTREAERVVRHRTRRRIVTILILLGNAGLITIIATLVASFTQVNSNEWFFIRLAIILVSIFVFYKLIMGSRLGNRMLQWTRKPLINRILREAPVFDEIYSAGKGWGISLVLIKKNSQYADSTLADIAIEGDMQILAIDRHDEFVAQPGSEDRLGEGDRLLVYGHTKSIERLSA